MPHGNTKFDEIIGKPISPADILPLYCFKLSFKMLLNTSDDIPVVYELIKKNQKE